ncbi:MAG: hypothetical protein QW797_06600 [Thermoproteota archaeon]
MSEQKPLLWIVLISLLMLFVSGAWTIASIMFFTQNKTLSSIMLATATASSISFLLTLLVAMLLYSGVEKGRRLMMMMVGLFSAGIIFLVYTVLFFLIAFLTAPPLFLD